MRLASLKTPDTKRYTVNTFGGYDLREGREGYTFQEMENMTGKYSPLLSSRDRRGKIDTENHTVKGIISSDIRTSGGIIEGVLLADCEDRLRAFYEEDGAFLSHDIMLSQNTEGKKSYVLSASKLIMFPEKKYVDLMDYTKSGFLECTVTYPLGVSEGYYYELSFSPCDIEGESVSGTSSYMKMVRNCYYLSNGGKGSFYRAMAINSGFSEGDTVKISGLTDSSLNGKYYSIKHISTDRKEVVFECAAPFSQNTGNVIISRELPEMDYVISCKNRLWGCRYGIDSDGNSLNEIYASALGDEGNFHKFNGISTDSWAASVGAPGAFTGAAVFGGHPVFFKEDCIIKIFGDYPGEFSLSETKVRGIEKGSAGSIAAVNDCLYYKSVDGIVRYDGGIPRNVDSALGNMRYKNAVAGALLSRYYVSMEDENGDSHLFVYDTVTGEWHREDSIGIQSFCRHGGELYMLTSDGEILTSGEKDGGESEENVSWYCVTRDIGFETPEHKYISSVLLRLVPEDGGRADAEIEYDRDGIWHTVAAVKGKNHRTVLTFAPARCDSFRIRLSGNGTVKVRSVTFTLEKAGDSI